MKRRSLFLILTVTVFCCGAMALIDGVWMPGYVVKSALKAVVFLLFPLLCARVSSVITCRSLFRINKKGLFTALLLGLGVYGVIVGGYFLVSPFFDFSNIAGSLTSNAGVTKENFLFVSCYISFVNSLLEEFFFRGFVFTNLKRVSSRGFAYGFSAGIFALYHTAMMLGWFSLPLFLLVLAGLTVGGLIFNRLNESHGSVVVSWLTHMFANFAINTIGFLLLK